VKRLAPNKRMIFRERERLVFKEAICKAEAEMAHRAQESSKSRCFRRARWSGQSFGVEIFQFFKPSQNLQHLGFLLATLGRQHQVGNEVSTNLTWSSSGLSKQRRQVNLRSYRTLLCGGCADHTHWLFGSQGHSARSSGKLPKGVQNISPTIAHAYDRHPGPTNLMGSGARLLEAFMAGVCLCWVKVNGGAIQAQFLSGGQLSICPWQEHHAFLIPLKVGVSTIRFALSRRAPAATMSVDERIKRPARNLAAFCTSSPLIFLIAVNVDRQLGYKFCGLVSECPDGNGSRPRSGTIRPFHRAAEAMG
jgi:hypothetical protein